jgi:hypothetical protein
LNFGISQKTSLIFFSYNTIEHILRESKNINIFFIFTETDEILVCTSNRAKQASEKHVVFIKARRRG